MRWEYAEMADGHYAKMGDRSIGPFVGRAAADAAVQMLNHLYVTDWPTFAEHMLSPEWLKANQPWPLGPVPTTEEEALRRYWPWPLNEDDQRRAAAEARKP